MHVRSVNGAWRLWESQGHALSALVAAVFILLCQGAVGRDGEELGLAVVEGPRVDAGAEDLDLRQGRAFVRLGQDEVHVWGEGRDDLLEGRVILQAAEFSTDVRRLTGNRVRILGQNIQVSPVCVDAISFLSGGFLEDSCLNECIDGFPRGRLCSAYQYVPLVKVSYLASAASQELSTEYSLARVTSSPSVSVAPTVSAAPGAAGRHRGMPYQRLWRRSSFCCIREPVGRCVRSPQCEPSWRNHSITNAAMAAGRLRSSRGMSTSRGPSAAMARNSAWPS